MNCGCFKPIREEEIRIIAKDITEINKLSPEILLYEQGFNELIFSLPIASPEIKATSSDYQ